MSGTTIKGRSSVVAANLRSSGKRLWAAGTAVAISVAFVVSALMLLDSFDRTMEAEAEADAAGADLVIDAQALVEPPDPAVAAEQGPRPDEQIAEAVASLDGVAHAEALSYLFLEASAGGTNAALLVGGLPETRSFDIVEGSMPEGTEEILLAEDFAGSYDMGVGDRITVSHQIFNQETESYEEETSEVLVSGLAGGSHRSASGYMTAEGLAQFPGEASPDSIRVQLDGVENGDGGHGDPAAQEQAQQRAAEVIAAMIESGDLDLGPGAEGAFEPGETPEIQTRDDGSLVVAGVEIYTNQQIIDAWIQQYTGASTALVSIGMGFGAIAVFVSGLVISNTFQVLVASRIRTMALLRAIGATAAQLRRATLAEGALLGLTGSVVGVLLGWGTALGLSLAAQSVWQDSFATAQISVLAVITGLALGVVVTVLASLLPALKAGRISPMEALRPADVTPAQKRTPWVRSVIGALLMVGGLASVVLAARLHSPELGVLGAVTGFTGVLLLARIAVPAAVGVLGRLVSMLPRARVIARVAARNARQAPGRTAATTSALLIGVTLVSTMTLGATTAQDSLLDELAERHPVDVIATNADEQAQRVLEEDGSVVDYELLDISSGQLSDSDQEALDSVSRRDGVTLEELIGEEGNVGPESAEGGALLVVRVNDSASMADLTRLGNELDSHTEHVYLDSAVTRATYTQVIDTVLVVVLVLLAAALVVAVVGVGNTLALSVFERRREAALLRAMGMTRGSVGAMVSLEAVLMAAVALLLGTGLGALFAWGGVSSLVARDDVPIVLGVPWGRMALIWVATILAAVTASALPARRLSRIQPAQGLSQAA